MTVLSVWWYKLNLQRCQHLRSHRVVDILDHKGAWHNSVSRSSRRCDENERTCVK